MSPEKTNPRPELEERLRFETLIADLSSKFVNLPVGEVERCGIDPLSRKLVVVKEGYLYPRLSSIAPRYLMLLTPGAGDMRIEKLTYTRRRKPVFPFEPETPFDPEAAPVL